ncbi:hypothetical protein ATKI12_5401 [Kitasatospora sp. Ki12]
MTLTPGTRAHGPLRFRLTRPQGEAGTEPGLEAGLEVGAEVGSEPGPEAGSTVAG